MKELTINARTEELDAVLQFVDVQLEAMDCPPKVQMQIDLAVEEIFVNIANYAYRPGTGTATIRVDAEGSSVSITFIDSGIPYDPLKKDDPDISLPAEQRQIGGLGILLVKKTMDDVRYDYVNACNVLTIVKVIETGKQKGLT